MWTRRAGGNGTLASVGRTTEQAAKARRGIVAAMHAVLLAATAATPFVGMAAEWSTGQASQPAPSTPSTLSTQSGAFGINDAIRAGETRRGVLSTSQTPPPVLRPHPEYARLPVYVGNVGNRPVRLRIGPKTDTRDSVQGEYAVDGQPGVRLLSGEYDNGSFLMEESSDGTAVTGNWEGNIDQAGVVRGNWSDPNDRAIVLPFLIRPLGPLVIPGFVVVHGDSLRGYGTTDNSAAPDNGVVYAPPPPKSSISRSVK
jgi:hypothetical protein